MGSEMCISYRFHIIKCELAFDDTASGIKYSSRKRAEYIERALYMCPACNGISSIESHGVKLRCKRCDARSTYTKTLSLSPAFAGYNRIYEWFEWERREIVKRVENGETVSDGDILFRESVKLQRKKKLAGDSVSIDAQKLIISDKTQRTVFPLEEIDSMTMVGKKKFNFYHRGRILQVKGGKRFCAIKYVHIFDGLRGKETI